IPSAVFDAGMDAQLPANGIGGLIHLDRLVSSQVVNIKALRRWMTGRLDHGSHAIADIEVGFFLFAISQNTQNRWVSFELADEVDHVPMGIAFTQNGDKAENDSAKTVPFAIGRDRPFAGEL